MIFTLIKLSPLVLSMQATDGPGPIVTDRPDFTESALVVPPKSLQIESGFTFLRVDSNVRSLSGPEILARYGVNSRFELRLGLPNYNRIETSGGDAEGFDDTYVGAKIQLGPIGGTDFAVIPAVFLPTGRAGIRSEKAAPEIKLVWGRELGELSITGMLYVASVEEDGRRVTPVEHTVSLGIPIRDKVGMFVEHVLDAQRGTRPAHMLHSGFTYQPHDNAQWDIHYGVGLNSAAPQFFIGAGYSVRF